jgi:hypothetical protein
MTTFNAQLMDSLAEINQPKAPTYGTLPPIATSSVEAVFTEFEVAYGANFGRMWQHSSTDDVKRNWAQKLAEFKGVSKKKMIENTLIKHPTYPPTLGEFIAICRELKAAPPAAHRPFTQQLTSFGDPRSPEAIEARERCLATMAALRKPEPGDWKARRAQNVF